MKLIFMKIMKIMTIRPFEDIEGITDCLLKAL